MNWRATPKFILKDSLQEFLVVQIFLFFKNGKTFLRLLYSPIWIDLKSHWPLGGWSSGCRSTSLVSKLKDLPTKRKTGQNLKIRFTMKGSVCLIWHIWVVILIIVLLRREPYRDTQSVQRLYNNARCLKIAEKSNSTCERSEHRLLLSRQKFVEKMPKMIDLVILWKLKFADRQCYQTGHFYVQKCRIWIFEFLRFSLILY